MLTPFWFKTDCGLGYGVTADSQKEAEALLNALGYPRPDQRIVSVIVGVKASELDASHVLPNAGPIVVGGVWFPRHNI